jgi:hypothetical protein
MAPKRKQSQDEAVNLDTAPVQKKLKIKIAPLPQRKAPEPISIDPIPSPPTKKLKLKLRFWSSAAAAPSVNESPAQERATKAAPKTSSTSSRLVPRGPRKSAKLGQRDESVLRMVCDDEETGETKELLFRNIPNSSINWNDIRHITKINNWRNQIFGRAGMKSRSVTVWLPDEELWFELYFHLSIAESRARGMLLPRMQPILDAFNETFVDRIIQDHHGKDTAPRLERQANAFSSKFNRMCPELRARLQQSVFGKTGDVFVPSITLEMLHIYKQMKLEMEAKGISTESAYPDNLQEWCHLFSHLPGMGDVAMQTEPQAVSYSDTELEVANVLVSMAQQPVSIEHEVAAALISMALQPAAQTAAEFARSSFRLITPLQQTHDYPSSKTPAYLASTMISSLRSDGPMTPRRDSLFPGHDIAESGYAGSKVVRPTTPQQELDIASLIASPD